MLVYFYLKVTMRNVHVVLVLAPPMDERGSA